MKKTVFLVMMLLLQSFVFAVESGSFIDREEHAARRVRFMEKIQDGAAVIMGAASSPSFPFVQGNDFYYFTGVEIPDAFLIIDGRNKESLLFFSMDERTARGEGLPVELIQDPVKVTGIEKYYPIDRFSSIISRISLQAPILYTMFKPEELMRDNTKEKFNSLQQSMTFNFWDGRLTRELQFVDRLKAKFPYLDVRDCSRLVWDLRKRKSKKEVDLTRRAAQIGVKAHSALIRAVRPGIAEYKLAAVFEYTCKSEGAQDLAYNTILMSGPNHAFGHYHKHDRILKDGDIVILDAGPDYGYYNADISTTFPVGGHFSPEQKELYQLAFDIRKICLENYRPGITFRDVGKKVEAFLISRGIGPDVRKFRGLRRYGGYNHSIGMATHDPMGTFTGPEEVLQPGFVFACDINIIYPEKELGVRLEDTVVITENGAENLSRGLPRTVDEIERMVRGK